MRQARQLPFRADASGAETPANANANATRRGFSPGQGRCWPIDMSECQRLRLLRIDCSTGFVHMDGTNSMCCQAHNSNDESMHRRPKHRCCIGQGAVFLCHPKGMIACRACHAKLAGLAVLPQAFHGNVSFGTSGPF